MHIRPVILITGILIGYVFGMEILFYDNTPGSPSFATGFSHFSKVIDQNASQPFSEPTKLESPKKELSQVWFFRKYPGFLTWAIMHIIGVALCFPMCTVAYFIRRNLLAVYKIEAKDRVLANVLVFVPVVAVVLLIYQNAYGFDIAAHYVPMNHAKLKIYSMEFLNYMTGAFSLVNLLLITFIVGKKPTLTDEQLGKLNKLFHLSLFISAGIVAYATLASGALFKALNNFYYSLYDPTQKSNLYFPFTFIIMLGFINTFLLSMFYFSCLPVFAKAKSTSRQHAIHAVTKEEPPRSLIGLFGLSKELVEGIQTLLALLAPLITALFS